MTVADASALLARLEARYDALAHNLARAVEADLRAAAPVGSSRGSRPGGETRESIVSNLGVTSHGRYSIELVAPTPQALFTDKGTRPHIIVPKRAGGVLVFDWPKAGLHPAVFTKVHHPGNKGTRWFTKTVTEANVHRWCVSLLRSAA